jgi:hypothetical protein
MILVDTSIWIDHLRRGKPRLATALEHGRVWCHDFVVGEVACGTLHGRREVLDLLGRLPRLPRATDDEVLEFVERRELMGRGLGWVDAHLLASAVLEGAARIWTRDRRLAAAAEGLGIRHG